MIVGVFVMVAVWVTVPVGVLVGVRVDVCVGVPVGLGVRVRVLVIVGVCVTVLVAHGGSENVIKKVEPKLPVLQEYWLNWELPTPCTPTVTVVPLKAVR